MTKDTGGPAFPFIEKESTGMHYHSHGGMTLRDWFAGQALSGNDWTWSVEAHDAKLNAEKAYLIADAMILQRGKEKI